MSGPTHSPHFHVLTLRLLISYIYGAPILETSRMGAPYIYDISHLRVKQRKGVRKNRQKICSYLHENTQHAEI